MPVSGLSRALAIAPRRPDMDPVSRAVAEALAPAPADLFVGFSGGMDSTVLLHAAAGLAAGAGLRAIHVNHQLHPQAAAWEAHCRGVCADLGVHLEVRRVTVTAKGSVEAAARDARYGVFEALAGNPGARLLLAHHHGDQAETVLLRLLQGRGVYGMPVRRSLGRGELVRPLLDLPRAELVAYARLQRLSWVEDPTNMDESLDRNYLRRRVLPGLRQRWPRADQALVQSMVERTLVERLLVHSSRLDAQSPTLPLATLRDRPLADQVTLLRLWLQGRREVLPSGRAMEVFLRQLSAGADRQPALTLGRGTLHRFRDALHHVPPMPALAESYPVTAPGSLHLPHGEVLVEADRRGVALRDGLEIRFRRGGERLLTGGHHRTLKHLLQEAGLAPWLRDQLPLLYDADGLAAVPGIACRDSRGRDHGSRFAVRWLPGDVVFAGAFR